MTSKLYLQRFRGDQHISVLLCLLLNGRNSCPKPLAQSFHNLFGGKMGIIHGKLLIMQLVTAHVGCCDTQAGKHYVLTHISGVTGPVPVHQWHREVNAGKL